MNVRLPKTKHLITTLCQIGITSMIPLFVRFLNGVKSLIYFGVSVPEVTIPLYYYFILWYKNVNYKLRADQYLFLVTNPQRIHYLSTRFLQFICSFIRWKTKDVIVSSKLDFHIVFTSIRAVAISVFLPQTPSWKIKTFATRRTGHNFATATCVKCIMMCLFFSVVRLLPGIRASSGTKSDFAATPPGYKLFTTKLA